MTEILHIANETDFTLTHDAKNSFKQDVHHGFICPNKKIDSKYFYDELGSELFNKITRHPDYYLTRCELEILQNNKKIIGDIIEKSEFNLVELGPGEGVKTKILLDEFVARAMLFNYIPIDISAKYLKSLLKQFRHEALSVKIMPIHSDYFHGLEWLSKTSDRKNLVLFLGSSIGNFDPEKVDEFLLHLWKSLNNDDYVLIGFDLIKDVEILLPAYNDSAGITRDFNLNLLTRINRELNANFDLHKFKHYATYNVHTAAMESYLISLEKQKIFVNDLNQAYQFDAIEAIHVENSFKYNIRQIEEFANNTGFKLMHNFIDEKNHFVNTLWRVNKK